MTLDFPAALVTVAQRSSTLLGLEDEIRAVRVVANDGPEFDRTAHLRDVSPSGR
jgi:hypothetical protein